MANLPKRLVGITAIFFAGATYLIAWSPIFEVSELTLQGVPSYVESGVVEEALDIKVGDKLARIEPRSVSRRLENLTWIKEASLSRHWLDGIVTISITPRIPVGIYEGRAIDASGTLFDLPKQYPGEKASALPQVNASSPALGLKAIALFKVLPAEVRENLIAMRAPNESSISTRQRRGSHELFVQWGSFNQMALKVSVYKALLALPENKDAKRVDLSAPHAPIAK